MIPESGIMERWHQRHVSRLCRSLPSPGYRSAIWPRFLRPPPHMRSLVPGHVSIQCRVVDYRKIGEITYYITTNELLGELSSESMISSHVKITWLVIWKDHCCDSSDSHMINCAFCSWKNIYIHYIEIVWNFIGVNVINRTLHGRFQILNLSSRVVFKNISLVHCVDSWNIFSILEGKFRISTQPCNILFVNNIDLSAGIGDIHRSYYLVKVLRLRWVVAYLLHFPFLGNFSKFHFPFFSLTWSWKRDEASALSCLIFALALFKELTRCSLLCSKRFSLGALVFPSPPKPHSLIHMWSVIVSRWTGTLRGPQANQFLELQI